MSEGMGSELVTRKKFLASVLGVCTFVSFPKQIYGSELANNADATLDGLPAISLASPTEYIKCVNESGDGWIEYELDNNGFIHTNYYSNLSVSSILEPTGAKEKIIQILIEIGRQIVGYIFGVVIDGIVKRITGKSGGYWVDYAARKILGGPPPSGNRYHLPCSVYPPHSMEYIRCTQA